MPKEKKPKNLNKILLVKKPAEKWIAWLILYRCLYGPRNSLKIKHRTFLFHNTNIFKLTKLLLRLKKENKFTWQSFLLIYM